MSIASLQRQIAEVEEKIEKCRTAKEEVKSVESQLTTRVDNWKQSYQRLGGNGELKAVKRAEVFEGEMADALKDRIADVDEKIKTGMDRADNLQESLSKQVSNLEKKIQELEEEKAKLEAQLQEAIAQEKAGKLNKIGK